MIKGCTLYFPAEELPLRTVFPNGSSDGPSLREATWFDYEAGDGVVRLNLSLKDFGEHLRGFKTYVARLEDDDDAKSEAQRLISQVKLCVGVILPHPIDTDSGMFASLMHLIRQFDGFMFVWDSLLISDGSFLVGPMASADDSDDSDEPIEPPIRPVNPEECRHQGSTDGVDPGRVASREGIYRLLASRGFRCSRVLPLYRSDDGANALRPVGEIAARLLALYALFLWAGAPEEMASSDRIQAFVDRNGLRDHLTPEELEILDLSRSDADEEHADTIGWRLENMWSLSWILGFEPAPPFFTGQISDEVRDEMVLEFLPNLDASLPEFLAAVEVRPVGEVGETEDLFYCAHNAVRSAQLGKDTVPAEFHPVRDGGAIHERRHSLTWALSPGTDWDDTDLST